MKKRISGLLCVLLCSILLLTAVFPALAATANMSIHSSAASLHRGDSFTITVSLSNDQPVSNGGVILSYDKSAFEMVSGRCTVANATFSNFSTANDGGTFVFETDTVVSGTIFTIEMRVRDNAPFGNFRISGSPSLNVSCGISGTEVSVLCRHNYTGCNRLDDTNHESTCSICGDKKQDAHAWDAGTVLTPATCKVPGTTKLTCTQCQATKEEPIPLSNDHKYNAWTNNGDTGHNRVCSVCDKVDSANHTWNTGTVLQAATCTTPGSKKQTCTACNATRTADIPVADHAYDTVTVDNATHKSTCKTCGKVVTEAHSYSSTWEHDSNWHFYSCADCGNKKDQAAHVPGPEATATTDQICTVCNRILQPMGDHVHNFDAAWTTDDNDHWHACTGCNEKDSAEPHSFDSNCDADCNVCGMTREPAHALLDGFTHDETGHWRSCSGCDQQIDFTAHDPGPAATITDGQYCRICQYQLAKPLPHEHVFDAEGTMHTHSCACGETYTAEAGHCQVCGVFPWPLVCLLEALVFALVIVLVLMRRR